MGLALLSADEAREIAARQFTSGQVRVKDVDLEDDYPNEERFRAVYKVECVSGRDEYDVEICA
mgnify:CR=1 FL=1